jgi:hypothetical protein
MRFCGWLCFLIAAAGICAAQESNFSTGPQYLMIGSPMFLRPIATPTLSLSETPATTSAPVTEAAVASETSVPPIATRQADLTRVYWGSRDAAEPASETASATTSSTNTETTSVIEITGNAPPSNLPVSIFNVGVEETVDAQSLRERGYGVTVSEASSFWKTHKPHAVRTFTNRDVERLHGE